MATRLITTVTNKLYPTISVKIYYNPDYNEYVCRLIDLLIDRDRDNDSDYFTDYRSDAVSTANAMLNEYLA